MPIEPWNDETWTQWTGKVKELTGRKGKELFLPLREAFTGLSHGPEMKKLIQLLGIHTFFFFLVIYPLVQTFGLS